MNWGERSRTIGLRIIGPILAGCRLAQARTRVRKEAEIGELVTMLHSPRFYNPTAHKLKFLQIASRYDRLESGQEIVLNAGTRKLARDYEAIRTLGTEALLSNIPDAEKRRVVHIQALEQALGEWRKQTESIIDQATYHTNANRLLDEINQLRTQP